jgi:hypothetical protein
LPIPRHVAARHCWRRDPMQEQFRTAARISWLYHDSEPAANRAGPPCCEQMHQKSTKRVEARQ